MACINKDPINIGNFLRWHEATNYVLPGPPPGICGVAPAYTFFEGLEETYELPAVTNDVLRFFINSEAALTFPDLGGLQLGLAQCGQLAVANAGVLSKVDVPGGYRLWGEITIGAISDGAYNPVIYRPQTGAVVLVANPIRVLNHSRWNQQTKVLKYRNPVNMMHFNYQELPGFYNQFRVDAAVNNEQNPTELKTFTDTFTGLVYNVKPPQVTRSVQFDTYALDGPTHLAVTAAAIAHNEFYIEGTRYIATEGYERENEEFDNGQLLSNGKAKLRDYNFSVAGVVCS